jgi:hypothetical protein
MGTFCDCRAYSSPLRGTLLFAGVIKFGLSPVLIGALSASMLSIFAIAGLSVTHSMAQEYLGPRAMALGGYDYAGTKLEDILIKKAVSLGIAYNSNIWEAHSSKYQDTIFFVSPSMDVVKSSARHKEALSVSATSAKFETSGPDSYTDVYAKAQETYLLSPDSQVAGLASIANGYQRRTGINLEIPANAASPVPQTIALANLGYKKAWKYYEAGVNMTASQETFQNIRSTSGDIIDQTYRNATRTIVDAFFNIQPSSHLKSALTAQASNVEYKAKARNDDTWRVAETITYDMTAQTSVGVSGGLSQQDVYNNPSANVGLLADYQGLLQWRPTQRLGFEAIAGYKDLGINYTYGYSGGFAHRYSLGATYLIWRNLQLKGGIDFQKNFLPSAQFENIWNYRADVIYEISANVGVSLLLRKQQWDCTNEAKNFNENIIQTSLDLRF